MKRFHVTGVCVSDRHYMVDLGKKVDTIIDEYISQGAYFTINRARQYGKTTMLNALERRLCSDYVVISISLESADDYFANMEVFVNGLAMDIAEELRRNHVHESIVSGWEQKIEGSYPLKMLGRKITSLCTQAEQKVVLMIDEADKSSDNQIFLGFLGMLRDKYLKREMGRDSTFHSVILSGVYDIKNLKFKLRPDEEKKYNSPWNIAADFHVDMSFSAEEIAGMLQEYEEEHHVGMDAAGISELIYEYTSGYPYLVSRICQLADERLAGTEDFPDKQDVWTRKGIVAAELMLRKQRSTLFDDMVKKLADFPKLKRMIQDILFCGSTYPFEEDNHLIALGVTFGFLKEHDGMVAIGNRIFETKLYDLFLSEIVMDDKKSEDVRKQSPRLSVCMYVRRYPMAEINSYEPADIEIYLKEKGMVFKEKSLIAFTRSDGKILAVGKEAEEMAGKEIKGIQVISPLRQGMIADYAAAVGMLQQMMNKIWGKRLLRRPHIVVCTPTGITEVEKKALEDAMYQIGAKEITIHEGVLEECTEEIRAYDVLISISKNEPEKYISEELVSILKYAGQQGIPAARVEELLREKEERI